MNQIQAWCKCLPVFLAFPWLCPAVSGPSPVIVSALITCVSLVIYFYLLIGHESACLIDSDAHLADALIVAGLISCGIAYIQYSGQSDNFQVLVSPAQVGEAYGNLRQRNQYATLTSIALAALIFVNNLKLKKSNFVSLLIAAVILAAGNAISASRTGLVELFLLGCIVCSRSKSCCEKKLIEQRNRLHIVFTAFTTYPLAVYFSPLLIGGEANSGGVFFRFSGQADPCQSRLTLWSNVLHLISQKPWTGWGWGELDYAHFMTLYPDKRFCDILDNAHNLPLHLAVELGVPFALLFCGLCLWLIAREKPWREQNPLRQLAWTVLALIALHSLLEYPLWYGPFQMTVLLCFYMLWRTPASWRTTGLPQRALPVMVLRAASAVSCLMIAGCAYAAWDYWRISQIYTAPALRHPVYQEDTLHKIQGSWLFQNQVRFAELSVTPLTKDNAEHINALAKEMLHFSPEAKVVKKLIESATLLGRDEEAAFYLQRFKAAFPDAAL